MKKVSVIIPCYNAAKWLPQCFLSLAGQTIGIHNLELIFVNDASTDNGATWNLLKEMERAYPEDVLIIDMPVNRHQGGARNEGLKYATGEYIAFVDADDWVELDLYEKVYGKAKEEGAEIVQFNHYLYADKMKKKYNESDTSDKVIHISTTEERKNWLIFGDLTYGCWNKLYKRELVEKVNSRFAEHVAYEEPLFVYPLYFYVSCMVTMDEALYNYRLNIEGTTVAYMSAPDTLQEHVEVQLAVWRFMKEKEIFHAYYEEIKLYFLYTCFYETLSFAKMRGFKISLDMFQSLSERVKRELEDYDSSVYADNIPDKMALYRKIRQGITTEEELKSIIDTLE